MSNTLRTVVKTYDYMNSLYRVELFDTGYVVVFRKTDDESTAHFNLAGRLEKEADQGYTIPLTITSFSEHYGAPILDRVIELLENFVQKSGIRITSKTELIRLDYQGMHTEFIQEVLNNKVYSGMKKWCILASILQEAPRLAFIDNKESFLNILESQIDPEEIEEWETLQQSANYIYPTFPYNGVCVVEANKDTLYQHTKELEKRLFTKDVEQYSEYITIVNLLKNKDCKTVKTARELGFSTYSEELNVEELNTINFYLSRMEIFQELQDLTLEEIHLIEKAFAYIPPLKKDLTLFAVNQVLTKDLQGMHKHENKRLFLTLEQYNDFVEVTDKAMSDFPIINVPLKMVSEMSLYNGANMWSFWIMMAKLFSETDSETFALFFNDWIELIEEERDDYSFRSNSKTNTLLRPNVVHTYFTKMKEEEIPARYLWYLDNGNE